MQGRLGTRLLKQPQANQDTQKRPPHYYEARHDLLKIGRERGNFKRTNRENPRTIPEQVGGKSQKNRESPKQAKKGQKNGRTSPDRETPPFETPPRLAALENTVGLACPLVLQPMWSAGSSVIVLTTFLFFWIGPSYGGVQDVWGEENVPENAPSRKILDPSKRASVVCSVVDFCTGKTEQRHPRGVENVPYEGGSKTPFWEGCHS